jgi:predicted nucleic acid-binding protein
MPVLDTNFLIALHGGAAQAIALLRQYRKEPLYVPSVVAAEFLTDWVDEEDRAKVLAALEQAFTVCYSDRRWVEEAARFRAELRRKKRLVRKVDVWIAAWSRYHDTPVITQDEDEFKRLGIPALAW